MLTTPWEQHMPAPFA
jgi:hypothetical protein